MPLITDIRSRTYEPLLGIVSAVPIVERRWPSQLVCNNNMTRAQICRDREHFKCISSVNHAFAWVYAKIVFRSEGLEA